MSILQSIVGAAPRSLLLLAAFILYSCSGPKPAEPAKPLLAHSVDDGSSVPKPEQLA